MKHFCCLLIAQFFVLSVNAKVADKGTVTLKGTITNRLSDSVSVRYYNGVTVDYTPTIYAAKLDSKGSFSLVFPVSLPYTSITIEHGNQSTEIVVAPGANLTMKDDARNFDSSLRYNGKGAEIANFLTLYSLQYGTMMAYGLEANKRYIKAPADFEKGLDSARQKRIDFLQKNITGLPADFIDYWKAYFQYANYYSMLVYPTFHEIYKTKSYSIDVKNITPESYAVSSHVPEKFDDKWIILNSYVNYITNYYSCKIAANGKPIYTKDTTETEGKIALRMAYLHMPPKSAAYYAAFCLENFSKEQTLEETQADLAQFKKHYPASQFLSVLENNVAQKKKMNAGSAAIDFAFTTVDGKTMKLSDLKGKVVYLDFWASWCGPCVSEMPASKKLREHFKAKDVVFIYVSVDEQDDMWRKGMEKNNMADGINTRMDGGFEGEVAKEYGVRGIPAYFLIDKKGNFAYSKDIRPSSGDKLVKMIDKLLE